MNRYHNILVNMVTTAVYNELNQADIIDNTPVSALKQLDVLSLIGTDHEDEISSMLVDRFSTWYVYTSPECDIVGMIQSYDRNHILEAWEEWSKYLKHDMTSEH